MGWVGDQGEVRIQMGDKELETAAHIWLQRVKLKRIIWKEFRAWKESEARKSSCNILTSIIFEEQLVLSVFHKDWVWYGTWKYHGMLRTLDKVWENWKVNLMPLSDWREGGITNWGIISQRRRSEIIWALLVEVRNASILPENISSRTRRYLSYLDISICIMKLPVSPWKGAPGLMCRKREAMIYEIWIWLLTDFTRGSDRF